ncbi:MAG: biotin--[acetyl-CoA-carboxylase] ligase [Dehalococcoidia bacterium]|nr:biotin--[acetyl-CoA-carboxylase] ligase [Dehalococcoidia bacterium]
MPFDLTRYDELRTARRIGARVEYRETTASTMEDARRGASVAEGAPGTAYLAGAQTAGRGRLGRAWVSTPGAGLYVTYHVRTADPARAPLHSAAGALAVADAVRAIAGLETTLKWPNDVLADGRKLAGVLAESLPAAHAPGELDVLLGIGVNLRPGALPPDVAALAANIEALAGGAAPSVEAMLAALSAALEQWTDALACDPAALVEAWRARLSTLGRRVRLVAPGGTVVEGEAVDVSPLGELLLRDADGAVTRHAAGDVSLR